MASVLTSVACASVLVACGGGGDGGGGGGGALGAGALGPQKAAAPAPSDAAPQGASELTTLPASQGTGDVFESTAARIQAVRRKAAAVSAGKWGPVLPLPIVPVSAANLPDGKVLFWAANDRFSFGSASNAYTAMFDPATGTATEALVNNMGQNMFCPGTTNLPDGRILVSGGSQAARTSIYDPVKKTWTSAAQMRIPRAYQANTLLRDGSVFTLGGSWAGGVGNKHAEVWTEANGWSLLPGVRVDSFLTKDPEGVLRSDNHMWLLPAGNGKVFHAGPSSQMHWIDPQGTGSVVSAGLRGDDGDSMSGTNVMYDVGKILKLGGSPGYQNSNATAVAQLIDIRSGVKVRKLAPMSYARAFHNSVVLPNGQVIVVGGQSYAVPFSDNTAVLPAELWDPVSERFTVLEAMRVPRTYHGVALLLPDARVVSAGGGLCGQGCAGNHPDAQIYSPHYLFNADGTPAVRPVIAAAPTSAAYGSAMTVRTDSTIASFALVRQSSTTHTVNNDQRRLPLTFERGADNTYTVAAPTNPGWALPGQYMLFAMNEQGVPSVARIVTLSAAGTPGVPPVQDQFSAQGRAVSLAVPTTGATSVQVTGLPPGLSFDAASATVRGAPTLSGTFNVTVLAANAVGKLSTEFLWQVDPQGSVRFVKFEQLSEINGQPWGAMAELNLLGAQGAPLDRTGWKITADSEERTAENGAVMNAIDGNAGTLWVTRWTAPAAPIPHNVVVDMGRSEQLTGLRYLPRPGGGNGTIARFRVYVSADGIQWGNPVAEGDFRQINPNNAAEKTVQFNAGGNPINQPPVLTSPGDRTSQAGETVLLDLVASDDQTEPLVFSASQLPQGLSLRADTGVISGTPLVAGRTEVTVTVTDKAGATDSVSFAWTVYDLPPPAPTVAAPIGTAGTAVNLTAQMPAGGPGYTYAWDFGDGSPATAFGASPSASHTYAAAGLYNVTVQVRNAGGQTTVHRFTQAVAGGPASAALPVATSSVAWMPAASGGGGQLWVVNADTDTVSVFDGTSVDKLAEIAVGRAPRSLTVLPASRQVWVANRDSGTLSVIDAQTRQVVRTVQLANAAQPWGVLASPQGDRVYVTLEASAQLLQLNTQGAVQATLAMPGAPRHMALTADGTRLLVSRFVSPHQPGEESATVRAERNGVPAGGEVWAVNTAPLALNRTVVLRHSTKPDSTTQGRGVPNYVGAPAIAPDGRSAWLPSKQDNIYRGKLRDGLDLDFQNTVRAINSRIALDGLAEDHAARIDHDNSSLASANVFHPSGAYLFTALETSRHVAVVDPVGKREIFRVDAGRAPQGLAVSADGLTLFVSNFMDRSVSAYDLGPLVRQGQMSLPVKRVANSVATEKLAAQVLRGKKFFYDARDPRLARDAYMSCAVCHNDGSSDGRTWDMTGRGEGLRNTISLRGRGGAHGLLHWSGNFDEVQDFEGQIRTLSAGTGLMSNAQFNTGTVSQTLGTPKAGLSADLDALAAYLKSLQTFAPSPLRQADGQLTSQAVRGRSVFAAQCVSCHGGTDFAQNALVNVGTLKSSSGQRLGGGPLTGVDVPTLRDVWATAPYLHDGSAATLEDAIRAHTRLPALSAADLASVSAFVSQIGGTQPAPVARGRYVRMEILSEVNGNPWGSMAEFDLLDTAGRVLPRTGWKATASSEEKRALNLPASNILDGNPATIWHSAYQPQVAPMPHWVVVDTGAIRDLAGFRYQPRRDMANGTANSYRFYVSNDGQSWGPAISQGQLAILGGPLQTKTVMFGR